MSGNRGTWEVQSSRGIRMAAAIGFLVVGALLANGFRAMEGPGLTESRAGFALGVLLLAGGAWTLLFGYEQSVIVDPNHRCIAIVRKSWRGNSRQEILFDDIADAHVEQLGDSEGGSPSYHVAVKLRSGGRTCLFVGFFPGMWDRSAMEARCHRLLESVRVT